MSLSQDIESRVNILDIVNRYVHLKKAGVNYKGLCPFHNEKTPSFIVSPQKNIAHCFSCGKGGGPIRFLMEIEKIEFRDAVGILAKEAGIELKTDFSREKSEKRSDIYLLYKKTTEWYHNALFAPENKNALEYLLNRKISLETIKKFKLGYSGNPRDLWYHLKEQGFEESFILESGIFVSPTRDKFFGRIIFPIANYLGHTVAFTGRVLESGMPKYLNSPASDIFDKSSILYGLDIAKQPISKSGYAIIVEGQMDTIALHQAGVDVAIGISGTALTREHIRILRRFAKKIYLSLDSDNAGIKATFLSIENLLNEDIDIAIVMIPHGKDPDEFLKGGGDYAELLSTALSPVAFYLQEGGREFDINSPIGKKKLVEKCLAFVARIHSKIEADIYIREISVALGISIEAVYSEFRSMSRRVKTTKNQLSSEEKQDEYSPQFPSLQEQIVSYIRNYSFLDLFFKEFQYTLDDLVSEGDFPLLTSILRGEALDLESEERLKVWELKLEEENAHLAHAGKEQLFRDFIKNLHIELLGREAKRLIGDIPRNSPEYLLVYQKIVHKSRTLGIPQGVIKL